MDLALLDRYSCSLLLCLEMFQQNVIIVEKMGAKMLVLPMVTTFSPLEDDNTVLGGTQLLEG
eukprot:11904843-Ditylum_brightwellii.AAC.1